MALLTRDQILSADDLKTEDVDVPEWGGTVRVRTMTLDERLRFEAAFDSAASKRNASAVLLSLTVCDEEQKRLFAEEDIEALIAKGTAPMLRVIEVARRLNVLTKTDMDDLEKKSETPPQS